MGRVSDGEEKTANTAGDAGKHPPPTTLKPKCVMANNPNMHQTLHKAHPLGYRK